MSLKSLGKVSGDISKVGKFEGRMDIFKSLGKDGMHSFDNIAESLNGLSGSEAITKLQKMKINPSLIPDLVDAAFNMKILTGTADETQDALKKVGKAGTKGADGVSNLGKGIGATIKSFLPLIGIIAGVTAAVVAFKALDEKFVLTKGTAQKQWEDASGDYAQSTEELAQMNSELDKTKTRINELKSKGTLTFTEQQELSNLERTNALLEAQVKVKERLSETKSEKAAEAAKKNIDFKSEESMNFQTATNGSVIADKNGDAKVKKVDRKTAVKENLTALKEEQKKLEELTKIINDGKDADGALSENEKKVYGESLENTKNQVDSYKDYITNTMASLNEEGADFYNESTGKAKSNYQDEAKALEKLNEEAIIATEGLGALNEKKLDKIFKKDDFSGAQQTLVDMARDGATAADVTKRIQANFPGLATAASDAGIDISQLTNQIMALGSQEGAVTALEQSFEGLRLKAEGTKASFDVINTALGEQSSQGFISNETMSALKSTYGDVESAITRTGNGLHLNNDKLREMAHASADASLAEIQMSKALDTKKYNDSTKALETYTSKYDGLKEALENSNLDDYINKVKGTSDELSKIDIAAIQQNWGDSKSLANNINGYTDMEATIRGATSALMDYKRAQETSNASDNYSVGVGGREGAQELYDQGWTGKDDFTTYANYIKSFNETEEEAIANFQKNMEKTKRYSTDSAKGVSNFFSDVANSSIDAATCLATVGENGERSLKVLDIDSFASQFGMNAEYVTDMIYAMSDAGVEVDFSGISEKIANGLDGIDVSTGDATEKLEKFKSQIDKLNEKGVDTSSLTEQYNQLAKELNAEPIEVSVTTSSTGLEELESKARDAYEALHKLDEGFKIDLNTTSVGDLEKEIDKAKDYRNKNLTVDTAEYQQANTVIQYLVAQKQELEKPTIMTADISGLDEELQNGITKLQEYQTLLNELEMVKALNPNVNTDEAQKKLNDLLAEINKLSPEVKATLGIDGSGQSDVEDAINGLDAPDITAKIKFDYDLEQLQKKIDEAQAIYNNSGSSDDYKNVLAGQQNYNDKAESGVGFSTEGVEVPVLYTYADDSIESLQAQLAGATEGEKVEIQAEIDNLQDLQRSLLDSFSEVHPEINADSSMEEVNAAWDSFLATAEGQEIIAKISADGENAKQTIADLLGITPEEITIPITAEDQATEIIQSVEGTEIGEKIAAIIAQDGATPIVNLYNMMDADPKFSRLSAEDKASLVLETYNGLDPENKNSLISQTGGEATTGVAQAVASALSTIPSQVTTTITTIRETVDKVLDVTEKGFANAGSAVDRKGAYNGTAHAQGTALSTGTILWDAYRNHTGQAYAGGNWGVQNDTDALINELGAEIIVSNGHWRIANNGYPTFANLKQGDIVFNHKQSEQLMKNGYVTGSHAKVKGALATGTVTGGKAFADGTDDKDEFKESFDGIDILLERIDAAFKKLKDSIDDFSENLDLQNSTTQNAIDTARRDIGTMQSAYNAYIEKANAVGLEDNWKTTVQNGDLKITEITDKDLKQRIDDYQDYYNKALSVSEEMADLQRELIELATQKLDNIDNYFSNRFDYNEDNGYETGIEELKSALDKYTNELNAQVNSGAIKMYSDEWYDAMSKISEYMDNIFDATISRIESVITNIDNASKNFNNAIDLKEARSEDPTRDDYTQIINNNNKQIGEVNKKRQKALADMAIYDVNSDKYKDLADEISNCDDEIYGLLESNEELKDSIFEAEFTKPIEKLKTQYENLTNELDDLRGLMNDDAFIDPKGMLTADGAANIALIAQGMAAAKQMTADYTGALSKLNGALESGLISQAEYDEQQNEILDSIRDSVGVTEDYKNELVDLYKKQMEAENDALHENIDTRKEALQKKKEYYDYDQKVKGQSKEINILKAQAAALSGVTNAAGQAKLKAIQDEIKNAENDLSETKKDHAYEIRVEGLDTMGDEMDEALEKTLEEITYNADKQQQIVQEMLNKVVGMYGDAYGKINDIIKDTGWVQGGEASDNNDKLGSQDGAQDIVNGANKPQSGVKPSDTVGDINVGGTPADNPKNDEIEEEIKIPIDITNRKVAQIKLTTSSVTIQEGQSASVGFTVRPTDAKNKAVKWSSSNTKVATVSGGKVVGISPGSASITCVAEDDGGAQATCGVTVTKKPAPPAPPVQSGGGDGVARVGDKVTLNDGQRYYYDSWGKTPAGSKYAGVQGGVVIDSYSGAEYGGGARNHGGYGVHIKSADGKYGDLGWVRLDQLSGYAKGTTGVKEDQFARINELGTEMLTRSVRIKGRDYTYLSTGDGVVPANITKNLMDFGVNPQRALSNSIGSLPNRTSNNQVIVNYDNLINIEGNATPETVFKLKDMMPEIVDGVTRSIMSDYHKSK